MPNPGRSSASTPSTPPFAAAFASTGFNDLGLGPSGVAIQPDGKIVWVGNTTAQVTGGTVTDFAAARFNQDGPLDSGFGRGGQVTTEFFAPPMAGAQELADAVLVQPDGKILIGGSATQGQIKFAPKQPALLRLNANGTPDTAFGTGGRTLSAGPGNITALGLDAAGDIFTLPTYAEFSPSGQADASVTPTAITASSHGGAAAFLPSGQFAVATAFNVARHDVDVQVHYRLPRGLAGVGADAVAVRVELRVQGSLDLVDDLEDRLLQGGRVACAECATQKTLV